MAGPVWDYNLAWWNAAYCSASNPNGWIYPFNSICPGDPLTGGYIFKIDKGTGNGGGGWLSSYPTSNGASLLFRYHYPKDNDIVPQQELYIKQYVDSFETALNGPNFADPVTGYRRYADAGSFIDYFILNELSKNVDAYRLSTFLYKDKFSKGGKLMAGPVWDYNLAWWNAAYCSASNPNGWIYPFNSICPGDPYQVPFWWPRLLQDPGFKDELKCRWQDLRTGILNKDTLYAFIDTVAAHLDEAKDRHFATWPILGVYTWPNPSPIPPDYPGEIAALKSWIQVRLAWLDANMPGTCSPLATEDPQAPIAITAFPNPFRENFQVAFYSSSGARVIIELCDALGRIVARQVIENTLPGRNTAVVLPGSLPAGMYLLKVVTEAGIAAKPLVRY